MNAALVPPPRDPMYISIGDAEFRMLARLVYQQSGIVLSDAKRGLVVSRLARRLRELGMTDFAAYCRLVESENGACERGNLISALTTNVTRFFREEHHFSALEQKVLPALLERARKGGRVRIWSAGCSTGEEPYSIAMVILDLCPEAAKLDMRILASDIDPNVIAAAQRGEYAHSGLSGVTAARRARFFSTSQAAPGMARVDNAVRALVTFHPLNLIGPWPMRGLFDIVFCRNVVIYFDAGTQERLWQRFAARMPPDGQLFIGHSERLGRSAEALFTTAGITQYRRTDARPAETAIADDARGER